jgi:ribonuclease/clavin/mitogillin
MCEKTLYEQVLAQCDGGAALPAPKPPRASASAVLWRRRDSELEVFWVKRALTMPFMGGFHAFPGGGISRRDRAGGASGLPQGIEGASPVSAMPEGVLEGVGDLGPVLCDGLTVGLLRELQEETGLELSASSDVARLVYAGRWLTPPLGPLRFDNRFFLLEWSESELQQPEATDGEAEYGEWVRPAAALQRWHQGEIITAPPILHLLTVLAEEGPERGLERLREPVEANLGPHRRIEFRPGVLLFPLRTQTLPPASHTNCYVLGLGESVLVDPGSSMEVEIDRLVQSLEVLIEEEGRSLESIWLTHHHPDHVGGVEVLRRRFDLPVCAHPATAERLQESGMKVDTPLRDDQVIWLEGPSPFPVRVLYTPGHASGHLCFLDETRGSLLAGDLVAGFGTIVIDPPDGNMGDYLHSLQRIGELGPRTLFPSHGPVTVDVDGKLNQLIEHRHWREQRILEAWKAGLREPSELRAQVYAEIPPMAHPLAERQVIAHLEHLEAQGQLKDRRS